MPLVQARHHYEKINDDDLELTEGEICRVLKKYTDGMYDLFFVFCLCWSGTLARTLVHSCMLKSKMYRKSVSKIYFNYAGWCFGQRESDGQQGWFPMSFMVEIDSDHAKYREVGHTCGDISNC